MNTILEGRCRMPFFTDMQDVLAALGGRHAEYNWLITDLEYANLDGREMASELVLEAGFEGRQCRGPIWLSGRRLGEILDGRRIQFVWAVFSGFPPDVQVDPSNLQVHPFADGNPGFWQPVVRIQHPLAVVEIVCWDNSLNLLLSDDDELTHNFREYFPEALDLEAYNRRMLETRKARS